MAEYDDMVVAIAEVVRSLNKAEIPADLPITEHTRLADDLKLDSLAVMDFVMALENRFDLVIPMDELTEVETVGDLARLLLVHLKTPSAG